jgi:hypothetical protein
MLPDLVSRMDDKTRDRENRQTEQDRNQ